MQLPSEIEEQVKDLLKVYVAYKQFEDAGFPIDDPYDVYPTEIWQAMTSPDRLQAILFFLTKFVKT